MKQQKLLQYFNGRYVEEESKGKYFPYGVIYKKSITFSSDFVEF